MKKVFLSFASMFLVVSSLFSGKVDNQYLAPMPGTGNISLSNKNYQMDENSTFSQEYTASSTFDGTKYGDFNIIAIGGVKFENEDWTTPKGETVQFKITATCPEGFFFVSQSNPAYKRPFELFLAVKPSPNDGIIGGKLIALNDTEKFDDQISLQYTTQDWWPPYQFTANPMFDIILCLPSDVVNGSVTYKNKTYVLKEDSDYIAYVNIRFEATYDGNTYVKEMVIPFTGYYSSSSAYNDIEMCSMGIDPKPAAANINMEMVDVAFHVADVNFLHNAHIHESDYSSHNAGFFLSSSANPQGAASEFMMVHEDYDPVSGNLNNTNSLQYIVRVEEYGGHGRSYTFDGTETLSEAFDGTDGFGAVSEKSWNDINSMIESGTDSKKYIQPWMYEEITHSSVANRYYHQFQGGVYVVLNSHSGILREGLYKSNIYFHVMVE